MSTKHIQAQYEWLKNARSVTEENQELENVFWAAYHAQNQETCDITVTPTVLLPLIKESAHTVTMIRHSINVVKNVVEHLNPAPDPSCYT